MNFKRIEALAAAAAVLALAGRSSVELDESLKKGTTQEDAAAQSGAGLAGVNEHSVYFAFDSYTIDAKYLPVIQRNARRLITNQKPNNEKKTNTTTFMILPPIISHEKASCCSGPELRLLTTS